MMVITLSGSKPPFVTLLVPPSEPISESESNNNSSQSESDDDIIPHEGGYSPTNSYTWSDEDHEHSDKEQHNDTLKHT